MQKSPHVMALSTSGVQRWKILGVGLGELGPNPCDPSVFWPLVFIYWNESTNDQYYVLMIILSLFLYFSGLQTGDGHFGRNLP